ncbi:hypothetical protein WA158_005345 [Blastocystis sp. Blastoise]
MSDLVQEAEKKQICFIFQDESRVEIPLSFLEQYPGSLLSLTYANINNYLKDEDAYYADCMPLAIEKVAHFLNKSISLSSFSVADVVSVYNALKEFFGNESCTEILEVHRYLSTLFKEFCDNHNCYFDEKNSDDDEDIFRVKNLFTEEERSAFLEYSCLFDFLNIKYVILNFDFDDTVPYENIYPANLHEIFPKLETYTVNVEYYSEKKEICITPSDSHYEILYKEYKRLCYKKKHHRSYDSYAREYPEIEIDSLTSSQIYTKEKNTNDEEEGKEEEDGKEDDDDDEEEECHDDDSYGDDSYDDDSWDDDSDYDDDDDDNTNKPDLFIKSLSDYSQYNNTKQDLPEDQNTISHDCSRFEFSYIDSHKIKDYDHPSLEHDSNNENIVYYILNIPICKQLKNFSYNDRKFPKLEMTVPPMLKALRDGKLDSIQTMNIMNFIQIGSYDEYKQIFKDIITTRVFPNLTTLTIECTPYNYSYIQFQEEYLSLFTREHFPVLHIYDLRAVVLCTCSPSMDFTFLSLFPDSLMKLINRVELAYNGKYSYCLYDDGLNIFIKACQANPLVIQTTLFLNDYSPLWNQLYELGALDVDTIVIDNGIGSNSCITSHDFHEFNIKNLYMRFMLGQKDEYLSFHDNISKINIPIIENVSISFNYVFLNDTHNEYLSEYLTDFCTLDYKSVKNIEFNDSQMETEERDFFSSSGSYDLNANQDEIDKKTSELLSCFSKSTQVVSFKSPSYFNCLYILKNCMELPIWTNVKELTLSFHPKLDFKESLNSLVTAFTKNQLLKLNSLTLLFKVENVDDVPFIDFIDMIPKDTSVYCPNLQNFRVEFSFTDNFFKNDDYIISNVLHSYPSVCHSLHKPITSIHSIKFVFSMDTESFSEYCKYLLDEVIKDYSKNVQYINLYIQDEESLNNLINKVIKGDYPYLKKLELSRDLSNIEDDSCFEHLEDLLYEYEKTLDYSFEYCLDGYII